MKVRYDVSASDPDQALKGFTSPSAGMYAARILDIQPKDGRDDTGTANEDYPMLEVTFKIAKADKKANDKFKGSTIRTWILLPDHPSFEATVWKLDQFLLATGIASKSKRKGVLDTDSVLNKGVVINVRARRDNPEQTEVAQVLPFDPDTFGASSSDDTSDDDLNEDDLEETEDDGSEDEEESYEEWALADLRAELEARELSTSGAKSKLVARLEENDAEEDEKEDQYNDMSLADLRKELKTRDLSTAGKKEALVERLTDDDSEADVREDEDEEEDEEAPKKKSAAKRRTASGKSKSDDDDFPFD